MYDSSTANPVNPQGTAGGGNIFDGGSLFGDISTSGQTANGGQPTTTNQDTAALGGSSLPTLNQPGSLVPGLATTSSSLMSALSSPIVLIGLAVLAFGALLWAFLRR